MIVYVVVNFQKRKGKGQGRKGGKERGHRARKEGFRKGQIEERRDESKTMDKGGRSKGWKDGERRGGKRERKKFMLNILVIVR